MEHRPSDSAERTAGISRAGGARGGRRGAGGWRAWSSWRWPGLACSARSVSSRPAIPARSRPWSSPSCCCRSRILARPLRGGRLGPRARAGGGTGVSVESAAARGEELVVGLRGRAEVGLIGTAWVDRSVYRGTAADPMRVFEARTWADGVARLRVPADAPFSYEGRHLSTAWAVAVRRPSGRVAMRPVWVTP